MSQPFVSIIIPAYNDADRLAICLEALETQTYPKSQYEVVVVDNGSTPPLQDLSNQFPQARLTCESKKGSYAARNHGISLAKGDFLGFTDSDCIPDENWIEAGISRFLSTENCGLVAGKILIFFQKPECPNAVELFDSRNFLQQQQYVQEDHYGATANLFTHKDVFAAVGLFNDQLQSGGDREWGKRVYAAGFKQVYSEQASIAHPARSSWAQLSKKIGRIIEGRYNIDKRHSVSFYQFLRVVSWQARPPVQDIKRSLADEEIDSVIQKVRLSLIFILIRYLSLWKEIQLYLKTRST